MAVIALVSAKSSPGCTTACLALSLVWNRRSVVMVEADTAGPSVMPGLFAGAVQQPGGLLALAAAVAHGDLAEQLWPNTVAIPVVGGSGRPAGARPGLVPGVVGPTEAPALRDLWRPLATVLSSLEAAGIDVIVDVGRVVASGDLRDPLLAAADLVCLVTRSALPGVASAVGLAEARAAPDQRSTTAWRVLVVGERRPYSAVDIASQAGLAHAGSLAWDPESARALSDGVPPSARFASSALMRTARTVADHLAGAVDARRAQLGLERTRL